MNGTFAVTWEEGGIWQLAQRGCSVHAIWFDDGSQWDSINGWRHRVRPITFADRVNLIMTEANKKFDAIVPDLFGARGTRDWQAQADSNAQHRGFSHPGGMMWVSLLGNVFGPSY